MDKDKEAQPTIFAKEAQDFVIKKTDLLAVPTIFAWIREAINNGVNNTKIIDAQEHVLAIREFQRHNPEKCKLPD